MNPAPEPQGEREATSASHEPQGRENTQNEPVKNPDNIQAAPEREKGRTEARSEQGREIPQQAEKAQIRGDMGAVRESTLPLYDRAVLEIQRCKQIDNIGGMKKALQTIQREGIKSYEDCDRLVGELRKDMDNLNIKEKSLTKEIKDIKETIGTLETYEKYLPFSQEIEKAGIFKKGRLEKEYWREMQAFTGSKNQLEKMGIDPHNTTAKSQKEQVSNLQGQKNALFNRADVMAQKSINIEHSQKMMNQLFIDHGIDYDMRSREISRALDRGMDR